MARTVSDYITGKKSLPRPDCAFVSIIPLWIVLPAVLAAGDLLALINVDPGVKVTDFDIIAPQLDSNGTPTLAFSIGVENATRDDLLRVYEAGLIPGRGANGNVIEASTAVQALDDASAARVISLKCTTIAATAALAGKTILVNLHLVSG
jgi:hypothetical protein